MKAGKQAQANNNILMEGFKMQARKSLEELAAEITRQTASKQDYLSPAKKLEVIIPGNIPELKIEGIDAGSFPLGRYAGRQIASKLEIPVKYFDKMSASEPGLLAANVNTWLKKSDDKHMIRTLDGSCRAFLSNAYRPIDNNVVAAGVLGQLEIMKRDEGLQVEIKSSELTERKMYLQIVTPEITAKVRGDFIQAGLTISNSEIGHGSASFISLIYFLACENGMPGTKSFRKYHVGSRLGNQTGADAVAFSDQTRRLDDSAFLSAMRDLTREALSEVALENDAKMLRAATEHELKPSAAPEVVEEVQKIASLTEDESSGILDRLMKGGDFTQYGLSNAVTNLANDEKVIPDYDRVIELQKVGADLMFMSEKDFNVMSKKEAA